MIIFLKTTKTIKNHFCFLRTMFQPKNLDFILTGYTHFDHEMWIIILFRNKCPRNLPISNKKFNLS